MAKVTGSLARRTFFWAHLVAGIAAGVFILIMSATGVLLTYEPQITNRVAQRNRVSVPTPATPLSVERLLDTVRAVHPAIDRGTLVIATHPAEPAQLTLGRDGTLLLNPYTGALIEDAAAGTREFFDIMRDWHRWLGGSPGTLGAQLMDLANLIFLFIVLSGIYLWLPAAWKWPAVRARMLFQSRYTNSKMRDYCWHHVFSFWVLIPLFLVVLSGVVISVSYPWATHLVYAAYGEQAPQRGRRGPPDPAPQAAAPDAAGHASPDALLRAAKAEIPGWQTLALPLNRNAESVQLNATLPSKITRPPRQTVTLKTSDASVLELSAPQGIGTGSGTPAQRARTWMRFVHTGEYYGFIGQTVAGIASLAACFLVYTGIALAYRRLIRPLFRR
ncbi:MAG: PepSY domain-containing protein [Gammaproteobacteria bacterium]|nr:PepSY domain-containing protein [Gammaproteobacteria bacterium]